MSTAEEDQKFVEQYEVVLGSLSALCREKLARASFQPVFSRHVSTLDQMSVLLDHDIQMLRDGTHPARSNALLELAHHAILLHIIRKADLQARLARKSEIIEAANQKATEEILAAEDARTIAAIDEAVAKTKSQKTKSRKAPARKAKGQTPKRRKR